MRARITFASNPRVLAPIGIAVALVVGSILLLVLVQIVVGIIALVVFGYLAWRVVRFVTKQLASYVEATEQGLTICQYGEETHLYPWPSITLAGQAGGSDGDLLFAYVEADDQLLTVSREFENYDELRAELARRISPTDLELSAGEQLATRLRDYLPNTDAQTDPQSGPAP